MDMTTWRQKLEDGVSTIAKNDDAIAPYTLIYPLPTFLPHDNHYQELVESIISQQLSVKAAATISKRFVDLFEGESFPTPEQILEKDIEEMRAVGLSGQKASYIRDLAQHVIEGALRFDKLGEQTNQEIIDMLTSVKGIGEWTAHMFLIFSLGRLDVLAHGDLGIRNGVRELYGLDAMPTPDKVRLIAEARGWHPYESIACWYIWKSLDNEPSTTGA